MKPRLSSPFAWMAVTAIIATGLSLIAVLRLAPLQIEGGRKPVFTSVDFALGSTAADAIKKLNTGVQHPWHRYLTRRRLFYDRERVEVIARSVTFPPVLKQGELILSYEYPNATIWCLDASYYAGKVQGLILAMDRDIVVEHELFWTIDDASDLFYRCLETYHQKAVADPDESDRQDLNDVREQLSGQISYIQENLRFAKDVKIEPRAHFVDAGLTKSPSVERTAPLP